MKILLIGKYPPMQGGISSKTYWLYKSLENKGFEFRIITLKDNEYSAKVSDGNSDITIINEKEPPWHIPSTSLLPDRLINAALKTAGTFAPDIIETNYLWPFCNAALTVSKMINKPFLVRHAGSDLLKFQKDDEFQEIMNAYLKNASIVVTNITARKIVEEMAGNPEKVICIPRYIPDPMFFRYNETDNKYDILFAGKINYHWKHKGIMLLLEVIRKRKLKALFYVGGKYVHEVAKQIASKGLDEYIHVNSFVTPEKMPDVYSSCKYVWSWEEEGTIDDFSNIIWEALFCGVPCITNDNAVKKAETADIARNFPDFLIHRNADNIEAFAFEKPSPFFDNSEVKANLFDKYMRINVAVYKRALENNQ
jgi:glycosyltransferase involved in cell wall biosynthesis